LHLPGIRILYEVDEDAAIIDVINGRQADLGGDQRLARGGQAPGAAARRVASMVTQGRPGGSMNVTTSATWSQGSSCSRT
jgi:hypothetical protein